MTDDPAGLFDRRRKVGLDSTEPWNSSSRFHSYSAASIAPSLTLSVPPNTSPLTVEFPLRSFFLSVTSPRPLEASETYSTSPLMDGTLNAAAAEPAYPSPSAYSSSRRSLSLPEEELVSSAKNERYGPSLT